MLASLPFSVISSLSDLSSLLPTPWEAVPSSTTKYQATFRRFFWLETHTCACVHAPTQLILSRIASELLYCLLICNFFVSLNAILLLVPHSSSLPEKLLGLWLGDSHFSWGSSWKADSCCFLSFGLLEWSFIPPESSLMHRRHWRTGSENQAECCEGVSMIAQKKPFSYPWLISLLSKNPKNNWLFLEMKCIAKRDVWEMDLMSCEFVRGRQKWCGQ